VSQKSYPGNAKMIWEAIRAQRGTQLVFRYWYKGVLVFEGSASDRAFIAELHWHASHDLPHFIVPEIGMYEFDYILERPTEFAGTKLGYYCWQDGSTTTYTLTEGGEWVEYGFEGKESEV
jgi:hypothetical protein